MEIKTIPWLEDAQSALRDARSRNRLPHALLIQEPGGIGGEWLAGWAARLVLCTADSQQPCGECVACGWALREQHPDLTVVRLEDDSKQLRIEQIRELSAELALKSHRGGYKVGLVLQADALNRFAANAILKTLEEPPPNTLLVLVAIQPSRLPATILSRCQRIRLRAPMRPASVAWLESLRPEGGDWNAVLDALGEAPLTALAADAATVRRVRDETRSGLREAADGALDVVSAAERWSRSELPLRLLCFENWLTERVRAVFRKSSTGAELRPGAHSDAAAYVNNRRAYFELLDGVRELRALQETPINRSLALELLLRRLRSIADPRVAGRAAT